MKQLLILIFAVFISVSTWAEDEIQIQDEEVCTFPVAEITALLERIEKLEKELEKEKVKLDVLNELNEPSK